MSKICVIVPVYKVELFIYRCIDSILRQTFKDYDLILVDDGSPDRCGEICEEYAKQDKRIHVVHQNNRGLSAARNTGIDWCKENKDCKWLTFIDSDDYVHPKYLEVLYSAVINNEVQISVCNYKMTKGEALSVDVLNLSTKILPPKSYYCESAVPATVSWGKLYRKQLFEGIHFPIGRYHEDEFITYKLLFQCKKIAIISEPLYAYYQNPNSIIHSVKWGKLSIDKVDALTEQICYFQDIHCITAEMQRLIICINRLIQIEKHCELFSEEEFQNVKKLKNHLLQTYPSILSFNTFIKRFKCYKALFPIIYYLYKQYVVFRKII